MRSVRSRLGSILFWAVLSAAFIGPGTVTTAAKAGASYGTVLLWSLLFSTLATWLLQEAAARLPLLTGLNLGQAIAQRFGGQRSQIVRWGLVLAVGIGCAAYQAGNLLGALLGLRLLFPELGSWALLLIAAVAGGLLWQGRMQVIAQGLGWVVAGMGVLFVMVPFQMPVSLGEVVQGSLWPTLPAGSELLVIALIGTTIVPYNLFLGSGLKHGQSLGEMRLGLAVAILLGGVISAAILIVGTQVEGEFSLLGLSEALRQTLGPVAQALFAGGLFAAGLSSATTAPLAAAITASGLLGDQVKAWQPNGRFFRLTWGPVLGIGLLFGLIDVQPVPAIILAQALNGLLLPLVVAFLYLMLNDKQLIPPNKLPNKWHQAAMLLVLAIATLLGGLSLLRAGARVMGATVGEEALPGVASVAVLVAVAVGAWAMRGKSTG